MNLESAFVRDVQLFKENKHHHVRNVDCSVLQAQLEVTDILGVLCSASGIRKVLRQVN